MSGAIAQAVEVEPRPAAAAAAPDATTSQAAAASRERWRGCGAAQKPGPGPATVAMEHVLLALRETEEEREARIRGMFAFFDATGRGHLDHAQIEAGLAALRVAPEDHARELLRAWDRDRDGRVDYDDFRRYMDDKELELYRIFQAIDVQHSGCIQPEELWHALVKAEINDDELARFVEHVDKDNNGIITFEEWRDFLFLYPHEATIENIYHHWERVCLLDIGEQAAIPEGISKHVSASKYLIAGGVAGAISRTTTAPLDRLKVIMQVQTTHTTVTHAFKDIWQERSLKGFFRGSGLNVVKVAPESAIRFYVYEMLKEYIVKSKGENKSDIGTSGRFMAGGLAGAVAQTAIYPIDLVKTLLQTESGRIPSLGMLSREIWMKEGPRAFYRGLIPSFLGMVPYAGIDLTVYESLKEMSRTYIIKDSGTPLTTISWSFSTTGLWDSLWALGATCVYPLQVIRTRLQAQRANSEAAYTGMSDVFWRTLRREGIPGFYKGLVPNLLKVVPAASITYLVYETMKKSLP